MTAHSYSNLRQRKERSRRTLWFLESSLVLAVVVPVLAVLTTEDAGRSSAWLLTTGILVWSGIRLSTILGSGNPRIFEFTFWLFVYVFLGLAATVQIRTSDISSTTKDMPANVDVPTALIIVMSIVAFEVGRILPQLVLNRAPALPRWHISPPMTWLLFLVGIIFTFYYVQSLGISTFFQSRDVRHEARSGAFADTSSSAVVSALAWVPLLVSAGSFLTLRRHLLRTGCRPRYGLAALVAIVGVVVVINPISGARFTSGTVLFAILCYTGILVRKQFTRVILAGLLGAFLFLFPIADAFRKTEVDAGRAGFFAEYQGNGDYDSFWQIANAYLFTEANGPTWGHQALGVLLFWVPRSLWPDKPKGTGVLLAEFRGYDFTNLSAPLWAEALINGGLLILVVVFLALGMLLVRLDRSVPRAMAGDSGLAIAVCILPAYMIILLRGSLLAASGILVVMLVSVAFVSLRRSSAATPHARATVAGSRESRDP